MEVPFRKFYDAVYRFGLQSSTPPEHLEYGIEHFPRYSNWSLGWLWNMLWYSDLLRKAKDVGSEYATEERVRQLPASHNNLTSHESESLYKISTGLRLISLNLKRLPSYREVLKREQRCLELCSISEITPTDSINTANCTSFCQKPIAMLANDVSSQVEAWRNDALKCMSKHSVTTGDKNAEAFDNCVKDYGEKLMKHVGTVESFDNWVKGYQAAFQTNELEKYVPGLSR
mmetsp:Transcript_32670/g.56780  ORF Transcript_32670/g.56780 Transcript_32670/m.56780 type:complete len:230 (+) Transcript_32670:2689-3378(+)